MLSELTGTDYGKVWIAKPILDIINADVSEDATPNRAG